MRDVEGASLLIHWVSLDVKPQGSPFLRQRVHRDLVTVGNKVTLRCLAKRQFEDAKNSKKKKKKGVPRPVN